MRKIYNFKIFSRILRFFRVIKSGNRINRKINIYRTKNLMKYSKKRNKIGLKNIIIFLVIVCTFLYIHISNYRAESIYFGIYVFLGVMIYLLFFEKIKERKKIDEEIIKIKEKQTREHVNFLKKVKEIEKYEKNQIEEIILQNEEGYGIQNWNIGRKTSLLIGKNTVRNKVDIDVSKSEFSNLVSRIHGVINRINGVWYYEDLGSQNGSGLEKNINNEKIRIEKNEPIKVEKGDIIYLPVTKLLIK